GIVVFQEVDSSTARSAPRSALFDKSVGWILTTLRRAGLEPDLGSKLYPLLRSAGFPRPSLLAGARVEGGPDSRAYAYVVETVRSLMPMMERLGIATSREIDIASLEERLRLEVVGGGGVVFLPSMVGAWARKPVPAPTAPEGGRTRL
ncbi:MAG TPA: hypothetical protein VGR00_14815, partial [Thermoanaerobaculia bacterium]|nr:hypothetical protein [Thermoanaerobaculia bacterium]